MSEKKLTLTFCGGTGTVTGANFLLEGEGKKFLIDCGLTQNVKLADDTNWDPFPYDPKTIDILFITHSHIDHIGRIPKIIHEGFQGKIISTPATKAVAEFMLLDTVNILGRSEEHDLKNIYTEESVRKALSLWETLDYHNTLNVDHGFRFMFRDAGHILGSGMLEIVFNGKKIVFTGDLGNSPSPLLPDTEYITDADYMIMESVYGDRIHEHRSERRKLLEAAIEDNYNRGGALVIPTFSLERSQELLFEMNSLIENKRIPEMPIFFDSPLAIKLTTVYRKFEKNFNENAQKIIGSGDDIFNFPGLHITLETQDSKDILKAPNPKIIIAGSGMSNGGRIVHHERNYLPDEKNTILLTGYQSLGTLGRSIEDGAKTVRISGEDVHVRAHVAKISGYSGHKDSDALIDFVEKTANTLKKLFVVMGEPKSSLFLVQKLRDNLAVNASAPALGDKVEIVC